jgi:D-alanyl-D-alanine carboxypeptidase (penicillin-binding protein 5/6)
MKRLFTIVLAALALASPARAGAPPVTASAFLVLNASTGEVLASRAAHARVPVASLTKLMTVLVALQHAPLTKTITVDTSAAEVGESSIHLRRGERVTLSDLIKGALIQSANDAADAIADGISPSREAFVEDMNANARELGLDDTHFVRPDGLDAPGHFSSAWDITRLAEFSMRNSFVRSVVRERADTIAGGRRLHTWNDLLGVFPGLFGVKTGHTGGAGWCEVAAARGHGVTIYATILGSPSRAQLNFDLSALLRWGLSRYRVSRVIATGRTYALAETGYGRAAVPLVSTRTVRRAVRIDRPLVTRIVAAGAVALPVQRGERLGSVRVYDARGRVVAVQPLVAARSIARPGVAGRIRFYVRRTVHHFLGLFS